LKYRFLRLVLRLLFELRYRKRHNHVCLEKLEGLHLVIAPEVFNPSLFGSSPFLLKYLIKHQHLWGSSSNVLDLGCGSGLLGIQLARAGSRVVATDINPQAVWVAGVNARLNNCDSYHETRQGSLYTPLLITEKFDLIVMNPPYYAHTPHTALEQAFMAGPQLEVLTAMLVGVASHLKAGGQALAVLSSTIPLGPSLEAARQAGLSWQVVAQRRYWAEWHLIYQFCLTNDDANV
jgi:methylase of polypeptide subunit release factors